MLRTIPSAITVVIYWREIPSVAVSVMNLYTLTLLESEAQEIIRIKSWSGISIRYTKQLISM